MRAGHFSASLLALVLSATIAGCASPQTTPTPSAQGSHPQQSQQTDPTSPTAEIPDSTTVAYLGPEGTYTEEATKLFFGTNDQLAPQESVPKALEAVAAGTASYAVIPQENTLGGPVTDYVDALLAQKDVSVVGEVVLPIRQTLMGLPGTDLSKVTRVVSHKQGLQQSAAWLDGNLPSAERVEAKSTAAAAQEVASAGDSTSVAIAAPGAASLYGLEVLQANVSLSDANKTRFYVVSRTAHTRDGYGCALLAATCPASELPRVLDDACAGGARVVCAHDRPEKSSLGVYRYQIELERDGGFTSTELDRLAQVKDVSCLGGFSRVEG